MAPPPVIRLHQDDNVVIARATLLPGAPIGDTIRATERIPAGHKVATRPISQNEPIRRYGQIIGFASTSIFPGQHVHVQNVEMGDFAKDYAYGIDARPTDYFNPSATFQGIRRPDGRTATRNYIGILTSVNCSAHVAGVVADMFRRNPFTGDDPLADFPNVDGVVALTHKTGCGMTQAEPLRVLRRTLAGYARHPNFSHVIVLGLGCEVNQIGGLMEEQRLAGRLKAMDIQTMGGSRKTVAAGVAFVKDILAESNQVTRVTVPASELSVALQCGGADGYSGVSANPALGAASDPAYKTRRFGRPVHCHYSFMHENLMDMNHQFLHRRQMGQIAPRYLGRRSGPGWIECDYTFARTSGEDGDAGGIACAGPIGDRDHEVVDFVGGGFHFPGIIIRQQRVGLVEDLYADRLPGHRNALT